MRPPYFFSQPDANDGPTIWLETGEANALPILRQSDLAARAPSDARARLWSLIERAIGTTDAGMTEPTPSDAVARLRMGALEAAEKFIQSGHFLTRNFDLTGNPITAQFPSAREHLDLALETARFLLGENA